jgi:TPP-dependent pyruvate/acetoin dehydrogenase alpha subunit
MISMAQRSAALMGDQLELYRRMWVLRLLDMALEELRIDGRLNRPVRAAFGQEAVAIGTAAALRPRDILSTSVPHLRHAQQVGLSLPLGRAIAEMIGPSLSVGDAAEEGAPDVRRHGLASPAVALGQPALWAAGHAYSQWTADEGAVTLCAIGYPDTNSSDFDEAASIAVSWRLPVVFVVENIRSVSAARADGRVRECHGLPVLSVDGNDVEAVRDTVAEAVQRASAGEGPTLVEAVTYRRNDVDGSDPVADREPAGSERLLDPLICARRRLIGAGISASHLYQVERNARRLVAEAESFAKSMSRGREPAPVQQSEPRWVTS